MLFLQRFERSNFIIITKSNTHYLLNFMDTIIAFYSDIYPFDLKAFSICPTLFNIETISGTNIRFIFFTILIPFTLKPFDSNDALILFPSSLNIGTKATAILIIIPISLVFILNIFNGVNIFSIEFDNCCGVKFRVKVYVKLHTSINLIPINIACSFDINIKFINTTNIINGSNFIILLIADFKFTFPINISIKFKINIAPIIL